MNNTPTGKVGRRAIVPWLRSLFIIPIIVLFHINLRVETPLVMIQIATIVTT